jgi:hypothetical protein
MDLTNYPFLHVLWSMFLLFVFFAWIWVVVSVFIDNFGAPTTVASRRLYGRSSSSSYRSSACCST